MKTGSCLATIPSSELCLLALRYIHYLDQYKIERASLGELLNVLVLYCSLLRWRASTKYL
jgi:hypothetical protein